MKSRFLGLLAVGLLAGSMAADAATILRLNATYSADPFYNFWIDFADTGDGLLQIEEITAFSGYAGDTSIVGGVPAITNFATYGVLSTYSYNCSSSTQSGDWCFPIDEFGARVPAASAFQYNLVGATVPEPGTLALLGLGLAGLAAARRRKQ